MQKINLDQQLLEKLRKTAKKTVRDDKSLTYLQRLDQLCAEYGFTYTSLKKHVEKLEQEAFVAQNISLEYLLNNAASGPRAVVSPPITFAVSNCQRLGLAPNGIEEYWSADVKAVRYMVLNKVFTRILFVETPGEMVFLAGIENPEGIDECLKPEAALNQMEFIQFLRNENVQSNKILGLLSVLFLGHEYATAGKVSAAYLAARGLTHPFGVGYQDRNGTYQLIQIKPGLDSGFDGTKFLAFDELGEV